MPRPLLPTPRWSARPPSGKDGIHAVPTAATLKSTGSGAVFLVPVQVSVLHTPSPSVTPTNLLYNVTATVLLPIGGWLAIGCGPAAKGAPPAADDRRITAAALLVGVVGGIYGIGGGSLLAPALVGLGFSVAEVAPAALASTFLTSIVAVALAIRYVVLALG